MHSVLFMLERTLRYNTLQKASKSDKKAKAAPEKKAESSDDESDSEPEVKKKPAAVSATPHLFRLHILSTHIKVYKWQGEVKTFPFEEGTSEGGIKRRVF